MQDRVDRIKAGDADACAQMVEELRPHIQLDAVVVCCPRSVARIGGRADYTDAFLARGIPARRCLTRVIPVASSRALRNSGGTGLAPVEHMASIGVDRTLLPESNCPVVLVDDIVTTGSTMLGCLLALRHAGFVGAVMGLAYGRLTHGPPCETQPAPLWLNEPASMIEGSGAAGGGADGRDLAG